MHRIWALTQERSIMLGLMAAMLVITAIGVGGMATSLIVAERVQGSGSAINVAGSLRRLSHRMGSIALGDILNKASDKDPLREAIEHFEETLAHDALLHVLRRQADSEFAATYQDVRQTWSARLKPMLLEEMQTWPHPHRPSRHNELLLLIDEFVAQLNIMVAQLEADTEQRIRDLRGILLGAMLITLALLVSGLVGIQRGILLPLGALLNNAARIARGDFSARVRHVGRNELGQVGQAFNFMAADLSKLYQGLEQRVAEKTAELTRSNQSLALLYNAIANLHHAPMAPDTYRAMLEELNALLDLRGGMACLLPKHGGMASVLASTLPACKEREAGECTLCTVKFDASMMWNYRNEGGVELLTVPLRDKDGLYGVMRLGLAHGRRLEGWQAQLLEALARHIGIALGISHKTEQERLLALQEERSIIARELHDSIAQSLSYLKIQASLLQPVLADPTRRGEAEATLRDLREGISAAYRQLRELLATFRLKMEGSFLTLVTGAVEEYGARGGIPIELEIDLNGCHLSPNQEIHTLQIIREALSNTLRHSNASQAWVAIHASECCEIVASIGDDGKGIDSSAPAGGFHYGLAIMRERARGLQGELRIGARPGGGTQIDLRFLAVPLASPSTPEPQP